MSLDLEPLGDDVLAFLTDRHLATLTSLRADGSPHVVPVGFTYEPGAKLARVITGGESVKARLAGRPGAVGALCQVDRARWLTLSGPMHVETSPEEVDDAVRRYAARYREPRVNPLRVVLVMQVDRLMGHA